MISSLTNSLAALPELPGAPPEASGASARPRSPVRPVSSHATTGTAAVLAGAAKAAKAAAPKTATKAKSASTGAGYAKAAATPSKATSAKASTAKPSTAKKAGPLDFLDDPKLSVEDKLLKLLAHLNDRWNKELDQKMKEFKTEKKTTSSSSSSGTAKKSSGLGGLLGKAVGVAKQVFPAAGVALDALQTPAVRGVLKGVAGPGLAALATATGFPELAPAALKLGPQIVDAAAGLASSLGDAGVAPVAAASGAVAGSTTTTQTANPLGSDSDAQLKLMQMQRIMDQQKEMFSLASNLLRSGHDARMSVIQNLRG